ncbi:MAG: FAD-binding protein, partial [Candidatus Bathyarchaeia archaeon]
MGLPRIAYRIIEDIVGPENISDDPAVLAAYHRSGAMPPSYPPAAVVMPKTTEEVSAIVKVCNRYKIRFSCFVTMQPACTEPDMLLFDLKRMDRVIEINEKDMYAVVEPGVTRA